MVNSWDDVPPTPSTELDEEGVEKIEYFTLAQYLSYVGIDAPGTPARRDNLIAIEEREMEAIRAQGKREPTPIPSGGTIKGSKMSADVPYIHNMALPFQSDLGLINIAEWANQEKNVSEKDLDIDDFQWHVHTEFGDGIVTRYNKGGERAPATIQVMINDKDEDGDFRTVKVPVSAAFFILDPQPAGGQVRAHGHGREGRHEAGGRGRPRAAPLFGRHGGRHRRRRVLRRGRGLRG